MNDEPLTSHLVLWQDFAGAEGEGLRAQLRRLVEIVPPGKRARVVGPILGEKQLEGQTRDAIHSLLLAKTLTDQGWAVELEPDLPRGGTPDLRIAKSGSEYLVEVRRVTGKADGWNKTGPLKAALTDVRTRTPIRILGFGWDGQTSFKRFKSRLLAELRDGPRPKTPLSFSDGGFSISYEFIEHPFDREMPVVFSTSTMFHGEERDQVRYAINDKLSKYKLPLLVALDLAGVLSPFETVEEVLLGEVQLLLPVATTAAELARIRSEPPKYQSPRAATWWEP